MPLLEGEHHVGQKRKFLDRASQDGKEDSASPPELDEDDMQILRTFGVGPYNAAIARLELEEGELLNRIKVLSGVTESDTGLIAPTLWDLEGDKHTMAAEHALHVARCTKIIDPGTDAAKYCVNMRDVAKYIVGLGENVAAADVEEGMRVGVDTTIGGKYRINMPLPAKVDPTVSMMTVEEKPDITYEDIGGCKDQLERLREVVEMPLLNPERFISLGIDPPKGVLLYGPPGTGKTLVARAVANRTDACYICVIGSELVQRYIGEGARMVRELFRLARSKRACILFIDEVDAIGGTRGGGDSGNDDSEVHRTMLEIVTQLDGFDARGNVKVMMATNRPDTLDPALVRPGRLDRQIEFCLPDMTGRAHILKIHTKLMATEIGVRFELLSRLCPNTTGAELKSVCTEAGMFAIRSRRKVVTERDFIEAINKVVKGYSKFSATPKYMIFN